MKTQNEFPRPVPLLRRDWDDDARVIGQMRDDFRRLSAEHGETVDIEDLIASRLVNAE